MAGRSQHLTESITRYVVDHVTLRVNSVSVSTHSTKEVIAEIRGEIARQGLTQKDLADRIGLPLRSLRRRLSGESPLLVSELLVIAEELEVEPAQLLPARPVIAGPRRPADEDLTHNPVERNG